MAARKPVKKDLRFPEGDFPPFLKRLLKELSQDEPSLQKELFAPRSTFISLLDRRYPQVSLTANINKLRLYHCYSPVSYSAQVQDTFFNMRCEEKAGKDFYLGTKKGAMNLIHFKKLNMKKPRDNACTISREVRMRG